LEDLPANSPELPVPLPKLRCTQLAVAIFLSTFYKRKERKGTKRKKRKSPPKKKKQ
jgi:hypothetical protein